MPIQSRALAANKVLGDRLVLAINNVPYTQLQIETYLNVKEALRGDLDKALPVVKSNWQEALAAFMLDLTLYQEGTKSSGFRPQREGVQKGYQKVLEALEKSEGYKLRFIQLGLTQSDIKEQLSRILTVENLKRSRAGTDKSKAAVSDWAHELQKNAIIRWFDKGKEYEEIQPVP
jgi:hypothetical protein